ncbi:tRNA 2-thiouridine(34) synthase MnmA [Treponema pedis]|uniref:tRNA 2-thiouridine(34) synthase MnmA n=1 Tax=Treponema pedis TaxID=409322 RepID=UPI0003F5531C|nr:tRNA 2-thiouridine(34) synthase MnmA [Treponema pedis]
MKVLVGLSGGVDSSVAAKLLLDKGYEVTGVTMQLLSSLKNEKESSETINKTQDADIADAKAAAEKLGIKHIVYDFREKFKALIIDYFIEEYKKGRTPNPCFICNGKIKFGLLLEKALEDGFDLISTGHYAEVEKSGAFGTERFLLKRSLDSTKDQSYFLASLTQKQLSKVIFPLAGFKKPQIRKIAEEAGLLNAHRPDSQDICFVPGDDYTKVINTLAGNSFKEGNFLDTEGNKVGSHKGLQYYTIGQRRGLAIAMGYPVYVVKKDAENNTVTVGKSSSLFAKSLIAENVNLIAVDEIKTETVVTVKTRYRQTEKKAVLIPLGKNEFKAVFDEPEKAVAEGQAAVFYLNGYVLGGGIIKSVERV